LVSALSISHLRKAFDREGPPTDVIADLSLEVPEGEFVSIVGPSGCGKTTLLHILGGFVPFEGGAIAFEGRPIAGPGPDRGMMFQEFALFPWRSVIDNVAWALEVAGVRKAERVATAERFLSMVGLLPFRDHYPSELSGGMKQRVALARVLAFSPRMLLMDEPFGALDAQTRELMQEELQAIWNASRRTVLFVTHDIEEAIYLADRILVLTARPGRIKRDLRVDLPRPRAIEIKNSERYFQLKRQVWEALRSEVLQARAAPLGAAAD